MYLLRIAKSNAHIVKPSLSCSTSNLYMPRGITVPSVVICHHQKELTSMARPQRLVGEHVWLFP